MNLLGAWKKVLLFGLFGAAGCLAGWALGEGYLLAARAAADSGAGQAGTLISKPSAPPTNDPAPPAEFQERLARERAKTGDVQISLIWFNKNDLDLHCKDPTGHEIFYARRISPSEGELDVDANRSGATLTSEPVENIYWAKDRAPAGKYEVYINYYAHRPESGAPNETAYKVSVLYGGKREEFAGNIRKTGAGRDDDKRRIVEFELYPKLELFAPAELAVPPGATVRVPVVVRRMFYKGEIQLKAENLPDGVTAEAKPIPMGLSEGEIVLKATERASELKTAVKFVAAAKDLTGSADVQLTVPPPAVRFSGTWVVLIGLWTAILAVGLVLALMAGQNHYLKRPLFAGGRVPLVAVILGAVVAGFVSGSVGQALYSVLLAVGAGGVGFVIGWVLLGGLLGRGVSFFVTNLDQKKATYAGLAGGLLGAVAYLVWSSGGDWLGRFAGAAVLGFCIGLVVAVVEAAFRRSWLEVRFGERETITVNLGPEPVKVGSDARACTVWARDAAPVALRYYIRNGQVVCQDAPSRSETVVGDGHVRTIGTVTVTVRTGSGAVAVPPPAPHRAPLPPLPRPSLPPGRPPVPAPAAADEDPFGFSPASRPAAPPAPPRPPAAAPSPVAKAPAPDYDDGLPMPMSPPPTRPVPKSILDDGGLPAPARPVPAPKPPAAPVKPPVPPAAVKPPTVAKPPAPASPVKPPVPTPAAGAPAKPPAPVAKPPVPAAPTAKPPVSGAVKPPVPAAPVAPPKPTAPPAPTAGAKPPAPSKPPTAAPPKPASPVKPPVPTPTAAAKPGGADACPTCGRSAPGKPGTRYCMMCEKTY